MTVPYVEDHHNNMKGLPTLLREHESTSFAGCSRKKLPGPYIYTYIYAYTPIHIHIYTHIHLHDRLWEFTAALTLCLVYEKHSIRCLFAIINKDETRFGVSFFHNGRTLPNSSGGISNELRK